MHCSGTGNAETGRFQSGSVGTIQGGQPTAVQGAPALRIFCVLAITWDILGFTNRTPSVFACLG